MGAEGEAAADNDRGHGQQELQHLHNRSREDQRRDSEGVNKLGSATSGTRLHFSVPNGALVISERAPPSLSSYPVRSKQDALLLRCEEDTREVLLFLFFKFPPEVLDVGSRCRGGEVKLNQN